ncbi:MAG: S41 family peptidase [Pseudomonadota bacterium]|nr:S41 family peptidase [Pseudomonadota bacterium]
MSMLFSLSANAATDYYAQIQATRADVDALTGKNATPAQLKEGVARLQKSLRELRQPDVEALAVGSQALYFRGHDVRIDLAKLYVRLNMKEEALDMLEAAQRFAWIPEALQPLAGDAAFAGLSDTPRFKQILRNGDIAARLAQGPASTVPYQETLSVEQRIAGLTQFWAEARANFAYFDHVPDLDWNQVYLEFLPKVMAATSTRGYYRVLMQLAPLLQDGHTNIYPPKELQDEFFARPPLVAAMVESRVLVERIDSPTLAQRIRVGDEIIAIDGVQVQRYAEDRIRPFVSSSTPQDRMLRMYSYQLLAGDARIPVTLTLRDAAGKERQETLARSGYLDVRPPAPFAFRMLPGGVAYIALDHFESDAGVKAFEQALPEILKAKALVIDVRRNGGGASEYGWEVLSYLSRTPIAYAPQYVRTDQPLQRARGSKILIWQPVDNAGARAFSHPHPQIFDGKVAVLTGAGTFSAGEDFIVAFNTLKRGVTIGETTGGSTGQPLTMPLPGGGTARICIKRDLTPEGRDFVGIGLPPDIVLPPTVASLRSGTDPVLERALLALTQP